MLYTACESLSLIANLCRKYRNIENKNTIEKVLRCRFCRTKKKHVESLPGVCVEHRVYYRSNKIKY